MRLSSSRPRPNVVIGMLPSALHIYDSEAFLQLQTPLQPLHNSMLTVFVLSAHLLALAAQATVQGILTPAQCRTYDMGPVSRTECDQTQLQRPPDPHTSASYKALRASGHRRRDVRDLIELMRDKTLAFNGDSVTEQVASALPLEPNTLT